MEQELHPPPAVPRLKTRTSRPQGGQSQHRAEARCAPASLLCFFGALRGVLRRKKARQGIRSTPTGLKRLKTQNTASYDCNAKWERPYLALPNLYTSANSFRKKNSSTLPTLVEAGGIEPPSESASSGTSPGAESHLHSLTRAWAHTLTGLVASLCMVRSKLCALTFAADQRPASGSRPSRSGRSLLRQREEQVRCRCSLIYRCPF